MKKFVLTIIKFYQRSLFYRSSVLKNLFLINATCRFRPTCSEYVYQAINTYGIMRGGLMGIRRILRCHPWSRGGADPVKIIQNSDLTRPDFIETRSGKIKM